MNDDRQSQVRNGRCPARLNPLAVARTDNLTFRFLLHNWETHCQALQGLRFRGLICGPHGSGKTTLLDQLHTRLRAAGRICWRTRPQLDRQSHAGFLDACLDQPAETILLVDSAEQLSRWHWWRLVRETGRRKQGLVATVHRFSPLLPVWVRTGTTPELFWELFCELVPDEAERWQPVALESYQRHRGNIRAAFRELYDRYWLECEPDKLDPALNRGRDRVLTPKRLPVAGAGARAAASAIGRVAAQSGAGRGESGARVC
jgi:hypothetical protein